jgi:alcohol dehydrogenase class IV
MVKDFQFSALPSIYFGNGGISRLPGLVKKFGTSIILVRGKSSLNQSSKFMNVLNELEIAGTHITTVYINEEPSPAIIDEVVNSNRDQHIDVVVGIGGGSVLDAGKAISAMMYKEESVKSYLEGVGHLDHPGSKLPFIAIPTTSGTGSEATKNAVLSETGPNGFKKSLRHDRFVPDIAVVDPELTLHCSPEITAASGMDCFTQLLEAYLSDKGSPYTDAIAFEGLKAIRDSLTTAYYQGDNPDARKGMSFAALSSGICLANAGLGTVHGFASSIGALYPIPHGIVCGTLMAVTNELNVSSLRKQNSNPTALNKYSAMGKLFLNEEGKSDNYYVDGFLSYLQQITRDLKLPDLKTLGVMEKDFELICANTDNKNNPVKFGVEELIEILEMRF